MSLVGPRLQSNARLQHMQYKIMSLVGPGFQSNARLQHMQYIITSLVGPRPQSNARLQYMQHKIMSLVNPYSERATLPPTTSAASPLLCMAISLPSVMHLGGCKLQQVPLIAYCMMQVTVVSHHLGALHIFPRRPLIATAQLMSQQQSTACTTRSVES